MYIRMKKEMKIIYIIENAGGWGGGGVQNLIFFIHQTQ